MEEMIFQELSKYGAIWTLVIALIFLALKFGSKFLAKVFEFFSNQIDVSDKIKDSFQDINKILSTVCTNLEMMAKQNQKIYEMFEKISENYNELSSKIACFDVRVDELRKDIASIKKEKEGA